MSDLVSGDIIALMCIYSFGPRALSEPVPMWLEDHGLIYRLNNDPENIQWGVTEGGKMLIDALCKTPIPVKKWSMP